MDIIDQKFDGLHYKYFKDDKRSHTLLFLHGFAGNSSVWNDYIKTLQDKYSIINVDLAGHGKSDSPKIIKDYLFENQAAKIAYLLKKLEIESVSIISYSYSCCIGFLINETLEQRIKSMIIVGPYFASNNNVFKKILLKTIRVIWKITVPDKKHDLEYSKLKNYENPTFKDTRYTFKSMNTKDILGSAYAFLNFKRKLEPKSLKIPLLVITGENDKMFSPQIKRLFETSTIAELVAIESKKHLFLRTEATKIISIIDCFLTKHSH